MHQVESISNKITSFGLCLLQRVSAKAFFRYDTRLVQHPGFVEMYSTDTIIYLLNQVLEIRRAVVHPCAGISKQKNVPSPLALFFSEEIIQRAPVDMIVVVGVD